MEAQPQKSRPEWDLVDEAGYESFPASDPPAWGSSHAAASSSTASRSDALVEAPFEMPIAEPPRPPVEEGGFVPWRARLRQVIVAVVALGALIAWIQHVRRRNHHPAD